MASKGETVKWYIEADTSGFSRGMAEAAIESDVTGKTIDRNLSKTSKSTENNFKDMRTSAQKTATSIRAFGTDLQGVKITSLVLGISALVGAVIELSGALVAASSTLSILLPTLAQGGAAFATYKTGVSGLGAAFKAISSNDGQAFLVSLRNLSPAAKQFAYALAGINKAFNSIKFNTQQALFSGLSAALLQLGGRILPTINTGMQEVAQAMNGAFKQAASLAGTPLFSGLLATIFADTARTINILSGALGPILSIFTNLYLVTRPYVTLLAEQFVNLTKNVAAYLGSTRGQAALNIAIQQGLIALKELGSFVSAVFSLLVAVFRTSITSGDNFIITLTGIIREMTNFVNSAKGQQDLANLFNFTSLALQAVAKSIGTALQAFFFLTNILGSLNPNVQSFVINFLAVGITLAPIGLYVLKLVAPIRLVGNVLFNLGEQAIAIFGVLGAFASVALVLAGGLVILGAIIKGPLGGAFIIIGVAIAAYIGLNYLLAGASVAAADSFFFQANAAYQLIGAEELAASASVFAASTMYNLAAAGADAGIGMSLGAQGAEFLQTALVPLLVLAAGVLVILSMLGVFSSKTKQTQGASSGLGSSLSSLQKSMQGVGAAGNKTSTGGLSALSDSLNSVGDAASGATGSLASFDKMNVLTNSNTAGISGVPSIPGLAGAVGAPPLDTGAFDKSLADMQNNFDKLKTNLGKPIFNPFDAIGKWIDSHPWLALLGFVGVLVAVGAAFLIFGVEVAFAMLPLTLIVIAIIAIIAIVILLAQNWSTVWAFMQGIVDGVGNFITGVFKAVSSFIGGVLTDISNFFLAAWNAIYGIIAPIVPYFVAIFTLIKDAVTLYIDIVILVFTLAWLGIQAVWNGVVSYFSAIWSGIVAVFSSVSGFFTGVFNAAWGAIVNAFGAVAGFFTGIWNTIKSIFSSIGSTIGAAVEDSFKSVINGVLNAAQTVINAPINTIDTLIRKINNIPGLPNIPLLSTISLPRLATGGVVTSPTFAQIGEDGAEAVMPLERNTGWIDQLASKINSSNGQNTGQPINLTVQIGEDKVANKIIDLINEKTQMSGRNTILV